MAEAATEGSSSQRQFVTKANHLREITGEFLAFLGRESLPDSPPPPSSSSCPALGKEVDELISMHRGYSPGCRLLRILTVVSKRVSALS